MNELNQLAVTDEMMLDEREQIIEQLMREYSDDILHLVNIQAAATRHITHGGGGLGSQTTEGKHLLQLAVDPLIQTISLSQILLSGHPWSPFRWRTAVSVFQQPAF